jgi:NAD(P)H dehydrogenase (quinone)
MFHRIYQCCVETHLANLDLKFHRPETLPQEVLKAMGAPAKNKDHPVVTPDDLKEFDGIAWGIPTRYGRAVSQISNFFDATGSLWMVSLSATP